MRLIAIILLSFVYSTVTDIDGNVYETVQIGRQLWMAENLESAHYLNGDDIDYYDYDDNPSNSEIYGRLYSGYTATDEQLQLGDIYPDGQLNIIDIVGLVNIILEQ